jgi:uncharacterized protein (TIGR02722 family)
MRLRRSSFIVLLATVSLTAAACGPTYQRGSDVKGLDDPAMSTRFDKRDIQQLLHDNLQSLMSSGPANEWNREHSKPTLAIYPLANDTSEHIDSELNALLSDVETYLVNTQLVRVVSVERQQQMIAELEKQHGGGFDPHHIAEYNKQLGAKYYLTGKVFSADERTEKARRVQYFMFMQLIDVATSEVLWQNKAALTKALVD